MARLPHDLTEDNRNEADISVWITKHIRYAGLQAEEDTGLETERRVLQNVIFVGSALQSLRLESL